MKRLIINATLAIACFVFVLGFIAGDGKSFNFAGIKDAPTKIREGKIRKQLLGDLTISKVVDDTLSGSHLVKVKIDDLDEMISYSKNK